VGPNQTSTLGPNGVVILNLNRDVADTPATAVDQNAVARLHTGEIDQALPGRQPDGWQCGGLDVGDRRRLESQVQCWRRYQLGVPVRHAREQRHPEHLVPGFEAPVKALLAHAVGARLCGLTVPAAGWVMASPWDLWWVCFRAGVSADVLGLSQVHAMAGCADCTADVASLVRVSPPGHPRSQEEQRRCGCLLGWAMRMREPAPPISWPACGSGSP
jgi:hypothetical protein